MSKEYKQMIYFVVATLHFYRNDIVKTDKNFIKTNQKVIDKITEEAIEYFNYELSYNQIVSGCRAYLCESNNL